MPVIAIRSVSACPRRKSTTIVALARKLLVAFWKYVTFGVVIEGATIKAV